MATNILPNESRTPNQLREIFSTDEILWFNDGRWGLGGYAIPNGQGKSWTVNSTIFHVHTMLGHTLFDLMHREDVKFSDPPHKNWWWAWQLALVDARKNLQAIAIDAGTTKNFDADHVTETPQTFKVFPVPFFGERVRQADIRWQCEMALKLLGEIQQQSANERSYYVTGNFSRLVCGWLNEMHMRVAIKYFGYTRDEVIALGSNFKIDEARFTPEMYRPEWQRPTVELSTERPTRLWWPTENDLSAIKGIAYTDAVHFASRWPVTYLEGEGDWESTLPGLVDRVSGGDPVKLQVENADAGRAPGQAP
jgi:hypothetical protein